MDSETGDYPNACLVPASGNRNGKLLPIASERRVARLSRGVGRPREVIVIVGGAENTPLVKRQRVVSFPKNATGAGQLPGFENSWDQEFSKRRDLHDDKTLLGVKEEYEAHGDNLHVFLSDDGGAAPRCDVEVVEKFCQDISLEDVEKARDRAGSWRSVWLDERTCISDDEGRGEAREHENPLTATGLFRALQKARFNNKDLPDAARRLIYISDLDPACIHALAATASCHQAPVLRNAIYKHLHFRPSISVDMPSTGYLTFWLDLHLPFFLLRDTPPEKSTEKVNTKPRRSWTDLSFLKLDTPKSHGQEPKKNWGIYEAHVSCVISGSDDWQWVAYSFVDAEVDGVLSNNLSKEDDLKFDQIGNGQFPADLPIWRPRDYWLKVFEVRIEQVRWEWEYLIYKVEVGICQYVKDHPFILSRRLGIAREEAKEIKEAFDWAVQTMRLLCQLNPVLLSIVEAWKSFISPDGDISFFHDTDTASISPYSVRSLQAITKKFQQLEEYRKKMEILNKRCSEFKEILQLRLVMEGKEAADGNGKISEFTVSVLYPVGLAAAIFSMQQKTIPFDLNPGSFVLTVLLLIFMVYAARLVTQRTLLGWSLLRRGVISWMNKKGDQVHAATKMDFDPGITCDEESNELEKGTLHGQTAIELTALGGRH